MSEAGRRELDESEIRLLIQFMSEIGAAMNGAGDATTFIRRSLQRIGQAYGLRNLGVFVVPTLLLLRYGDDRSTFVDLSSQIPTDLRLDQIAALYELVDEAESARVRPVEGMTRLRVILGRPTRFTGYVRVFALTLITAGIIFLLQPSWQELVLSLALAIVVGLMKEAAGRWPPVWPLVPAAAGLAAGSTAFLIINEGLDCRPLQVLIPPLATFLPGAALTVSMIELSNGDIVAGGSRLAYGTMRLFLLVFGLILAAQWTGLPDTPDTADVLPLSRYLPILGLLAFTVGIYLHFSAPKGSFPWLLLVVAAAWLGQQVGSLFLGGYPGGFVGGMVMIVVARLIQDRPGAPPLIVCFTPAFWLLVPGAIGLEGLARIVHDSPQSGIDDVLAMFVTMISIALGVLVGLMISGSSRALEP
ncbi:MAG TPA: threonine/serine exporter family protein [Dehalococcoidia bacterium]|jgi:uncharacterized membrane protein YjjP (DUF1212 family)